MKITPLASNAVGSPSSNIHGSAEAGSDRVARAKAIAAGQDHQINVMPSDTPQDRAPDVRRITMKTNASPDREIVSTEALATEEPAMADDSATPPVVEDTLPLSPQFAALAKQRRALKAKEREIADREKALESSVSSGTAEDLVARLKSQPLSVLQ